MIYIKDRHIYKGPGIYVWREMPYLGLAGSVLGNRCSGRTREERIVNFRRVLWGKMKRREKEYWELKRIAEMALHEASFLSAGVLLSAATQIMWNQKSRRDGHDHRG
jgi:hypothetical protein